jgi:hypothetical protein
MQFLNALKSTCFFLVSLTTIVTFRVFSIFGLFFLVTIGFTMLFGGKDIDWGTRMCVVFACFGCVVGTVWLWIFGEIRHNSQRPRLRKIFSIACYLFAGCLVPLGLYCVITSMLPHPGRDSGLLILFFAGLAWIALGVRLFWIAFKKTKQGFLAPMPTPSDDDFRI